MKYVVEEQKTSKSETQDKKSSKKINLSKFKPVRMALAAFLIFTVVLGLGYTFVVTMVSQTLFPYESNGSLITVTFKDGTKKVYGSELVGQSYLKIDDNANYVLKDGDGNLYVTNSSNEYYLDTNKNYKLDADETSKLSGETKANVIFQGQYLIGRFNQGAPSNSAVTTKIYHETIESRKEALNSIGYDNDYNSLHGFTGIPSELLTESGSGVDPEIPYEAALYQIPMIASKRDMKEDDVKKIIDKYTKDKFLWVFGTKRVNVLMVNLALDGLL